MSGMPNYDHLKAQWHPTKNGELQFTDFSPGSHHTAWWICYESDCEYGCPHEWKASLGNRTRFPNPSGCRFCSHVGEASCVHKSISYLYPELMKQWHPTKNEGIDPTKLTPGSRVYAHWLCSNAACGCLHEWPAAIYNRTNADYPTGCPFCSPVPLRVCIHNSLEFNYPEIAKEWDIDKNGELKPSEVATKSNLRVSWICQKNPNHKWDAYIYSRTCDYSGCPDCRHKTQAELLEWLIDVFSDSDVKPQKTFDWCRGEISNRKLPFDFYLVKLNRIIELDGSQHFEQVSNWTSFKETRKRDIYKMKLALGHDIPVIRITQTMFKKRQAEMKDILLPYILDEKLKYVFLCEDNEYRTHKAMLTNALKDVK